MGNRTVVILYNDQMGEWESDPELGRKIAHGASCRYLSMVDGQKDVTDLHYGQVVECAHADVRTLAIIDGYTFTAIAHSFWNTSRADAKSEELLHAWADKAGYRLVKKSFKDSK